LCPRYRDIKAMSAEEKLDAMWRLVWARCGKGINYDGSFLALELVYRSHPGAREVPADLVRQAPIAVSPNAKFLRLKNCCMRESRFFFVSIDTLTVAISSPTIGVMPVSTPTRCYPP
jgi:hypothetical protein